MSEHYSHLLVPDRPDFAPAPEQVSAFLKGVVEIGSAPLEATTKIAKLSGKVRIGRNAFTGETITIPAREFIALRNLDEITGGLQGLNDYTVHLSGQGPAEHPPFNLYVPTDPKFQSEVNAPYYYEILCNLRESRVSLNDLMTPRALDCDEGIFRSPWNNEIFRVPNAASARFWIEFMFGNWLIPKIEMSLELLPLPILALARESFGMSFAQGCRFE
jgi:hypothetical protein